MSRASAAADTISSVDQWRHNPTSCLTRQVSGIGFQALFFYSPTYSSIHLLGLVKVLRAISMSLRFDDRASPQWVADGREGMGGRVPAGERWKKRADGGGREGIEGECRGLA
ncbi:hypothetical protein B296_00025339 [Ensete ventricosum]|uniref:Uncharacterized protein n=1 Tax=Ensete ventricosum TaxID=4639 RepID=A0A427ASA8_ENSVE|nr:hypothetical protein B296_00025339 [Ensete ventricosum]